MAKRRSKGPGSPSEIAAESASETVAEFAEDSIEGPVTVLLFDPASFDPEWRDPRVRLYRENERTKKMEFHGYMAIDEASEQLVAEIFGGGKWIAQVIAADDRGVQAIRKSCRFSIPGQYHPPATLPGVGQQEVTRTTAQPRQEIGTISSLPSANESLNAALVGSVIDLLKAQREGVGRNPIADWVPVLVPLASGLMALLAKMADKKAEPPTEMLMALEQLRAELAGLKERPGPATTAVTDALEGIERIVKLTRNVKRMAGGDDDSPMPADPESAMWGMAGKLLDHLGGPKAPTQPLLAAPSLPSPGPAAPPPVPQPTLPMWQSILLQNKGRLIDSAMRGVAPELVAEVAVQFAPPQIVGVLTEFVQRPDMATVAMQVIPELQQFPAWTEQFFQALRATVTGEGEDEGENGGQD